MMNFATYCQEREIDEGVFDSFTKGFQANYQQAQQGVAQQDFSQYANIAQQAIAKVGNTAKLLSQKTGVPLPLATALMAAGLTGGATAVPFAALLYFVKQPLMKGANKAFDATWDAGAKAVQGVQNAFQGQPQQPATESMSFKEFIELTEGQWLDGTAEKVGGFAGRVAGNVMGYGQKIGSAIGGRIKEIYQFAKNNPKEVARFAFLVGAGAAIGAGVGKLTHDVKDYIVQKIQDYGVPAEELAWLKQHVVLDTEVKDGQAYASGEQLVSDDPNFLIPRQKIGDKWDGSVASAVGSKNSPDHHSFMRWIGTDGGVRPEGGSPFSGTDTVKNSTLLAAQNFPTQGAAHSDLGSAYRSMAQQMHDLDPDGSIGIMQHLQGLDHNHAQDLRRYGHSAAEEIRKRLASPDQYTVPAAMAGASVGGTGNKRQS